jgi:hypothetical protein
MNFNQAPYFDDFDEDKQYYKVLFKPGVAVQTRELNQLQTILQNQVTKFGNHVFKDGSMVIPGQVNYNDKASYVKLASTNLLGEDLTWLENQVITNSTGDSGVEATVLKALPATDAGDPITLIILYVRGNQDAFGNDEKTFAANATLYVKDNINYTMTVQGGDGVTGRSAIAAQQAGVYYLGGYFVTVPTTTVVVEKYVTSVATITCKIGIVYTEEIATYEDDTSLLDNAAGTTNIAAPGADRYKINTDFIKLGLEESQENFFELIRIENGEIQQIINASQYNILEEALAERTFDESGNYVVRDFTFDVRESRNNFRGYWAPNASYQVGDYIAASSATSRYFVCLQSGISAPGTEPAEFQTYDETQSLQDGSVRWRYVNRPVNNQGYYDSGTSVATQGSSSKLVLAFGVGRAYIQGFKVDKLNSTVLSIDKSREVQSENNRIIATNIGNYAYFDPQQTLGLPDVSAGPEVEFYDRVIGDNTVPIGYGNKVGSGRLIWLDSDPSGGYKIGFNDIRMNFGKSFERDVNTVLVPDPAGSVLSKSYQHTGGIRYVGPDSGGSSFVQLSGGAMILPNLNSANDPANLLTSTGSAEPIPGGTTSIGTFGLGGNKNALWLSWGNSSGTSLAHVGYGRSYSGIGAYYQASTGLTAYAWTSSNMILGGSNTAYSKELLVGDTFTINTSSNTQSSWVVSRIIGDTAVSLAGGTMINRYNTTGWATYLTQAGATAGPVTGVLRAASTTGSLINMALSGFNITAGGPVVNGSQIWHIQKAGANQPGSFSSQLSIGSIIAFCNPRDGVAYTGTAADTNLSGTYGGPAYFNEIAGCPDNGYNATSANGVAMASRDQQFRYQNATASDATAGNLSSFLVIGWGTNNAGLTIIGSHINTQAFLTQTNGSGITVLLRGTNINPVPNSVGVTPADSTTGGYVRLTSGTVFGVGTGNSTRFKSETVDNQVIYLDGANQANATRVRRAISENRMLVEFNASSTLVAYTSLTRINNTTATLVTSAYGSWYTGITASFASEVYDNFSLGINAKRLSGQYQLLTYSGDTGTVTAHTAARIEGDSTAKFTQELRTNDLVKINNQRLFITYISSNSVAFGINMDGDMTVDDGEYPLIKVSNGFYDTGRDSLLFKVTDALADLSDNSYYVYKTQQVTGVNGNTGVTITLQGASGSLNTEQLATTNPTAFIVAEDTVGNLATPKSVVSVTAGATPVQYTLTVDSAFQSDRVRVIYPVLRSAVSGTQLGGLKTKTLQFDATDTFLTSSEAALSTLVLSNSDIYRVNKVMMATSFVSSWTAGVQATALDVTAKYTVDNGQRNNLYDLGSLRLNIGQSVPIGSIKVWYDYFEHGLGDFFVGGSDPNRTSYNPLQVPYEEVPDYDGKNLNDYLDFRARVDSVTNQLIGNKPPRIDTNFQTDLSYYLGRKEAILLDGKAKFYNVSSAPGTAPRDPEVARDTNSLLMYSLTLEPYTRGNQSPYVTQTRREYRRYTMQDIAGLDRRIASLEEISSLNLLEVNTKNLQIRDNADPTLERYKTGFFVDNFVDNSGCELDSDSNFSNEVVTKTLNPAVEIRTFELAEKINFSAAVTSGLEQNNVIAARSLDNYRITGDLITMNYTTSMILQQTMATTSISVAPFLQANFIGKMEINPSSDIWQSTTTIDQTVGQRETTFTQADVNAAIARLRATGERRPIRIQVNDVTTAQLVGQTKTETLYPFCRANTIVMVATGLLPNTKHYAFFDDESISQYVVGAMKFTFDSMPRLDFSVSMPDRNQWAKWRGTGQAFWVNEPYATVTTRVRRGWFRRSRWVTTVLYRFVRKQIVVSDNELKLPQAISGGDAYKPAFARGRAVYHYANGAYRGSGVAMYQRGTTLYCVNCRGTMSRSFMRSQPLVNNDRSYTYPGVFYVAVDQNDPKTISTAQNLSQMQTTDDDGALYSDQDGVICALFDLPNNDGIKFLAGEKKIIFTDSPVNDPEVTQSRAEATYTTKGIQITITRSYVNVRNQTFSAVPFDPIAQSFKIPDQFASGAFLTDIDLFFQSKPSNETAPVVLEMRVCDATGRPDGTGETLPGSTVTMFPRDINIDETKGAIPTKFTFPSPVHVLPNKNYAFVLKSDSTRYRVWIATLGQADVAAPVTLTSAGRTYSRQASLGSFFKSQDGTLWTEDQLSDMKFVMNRAVFNINNTATFRAVNRALPSVLLEDDPMMFVHGSNKIRVKHINHGHAPGDKVRLSSKYWAAQYAANSSITLNGIPVAEIFGTAVTTQDIVRDTDAALTITSNDVIDQDYYVVQTDTFANLGPLSTTGVSAVMGGGTDIQASHNILYHAITPASRVQTFQETTLDFEVEQTGGFTYDSTLVDAAGQPYVRTTQVMNFNATNYVDDPKIILSPVNEYNRAAGMSVGGGTGGTTWKDSLVTTFRMTSLNDAVSPVIDLSTLSAQAWSWRIDTPTRENRLPATLPAVGTAFTGTVPMVDYEEVIKDDQTIGFDGINEALVSNVPYLFYDVIPGSYIVVSGSSIPGNNSTSTGVRVKDVSEDGTTIFIDGNLTSVGAGDPITIYALRDFIDERAYRGATANSKYITKRINLENPATSIKMLLDANIPSAAGIDVYYKVGSATENFDEKTWEPFTNLPNYNKEDTRGVYSEIQIDITAKDLTPFTSFQVKIVMKTTNGARVPSFRNLRIIAHA